VTRALGVPKAPRIFARLAHLGKTLRHLKKKVASSVGLDSINFHVAKRFVPNAGPVCIQPRQDKRKVVGAKHARHQV